MRGIEPAIVVGRPEHLAGWAALRARLWPDETAAEHEVEIVASLARPIDRVGFVALLGDTVVGFAEAAIRRDPVNGCDTSPVAFLESVFVDERHRRHGLARALCAAVEQWGQTRGCRELGSDADQENDDGLAFHAGAGFDETERVVFFRKALFRGQDDRMIRHRGGE